jgi:hypothetical protein
MKGRKIEDQVKLAKLLLNYAEAAEEDGLIVALDQEKAYDRINHTYLLRVLQHMGFLPRFCNTIKSLYTNAETVVMVDGEISESFIISRGVRQGNPLSCLLFNLAIEPLACLIRNSELKRSQHSGERWQMTQQYFCPLKMTLKYTALRPPVDQGSVYPEGRLTCLSTQIHVGYTHLVNLSLPSVYPVDGGRQTQAEVDQGRPRPDFSKELSTQVDEKFIVTCELARL